MGLLDELKKQADQRRQEAEREAQRQARLEQIYLAEMRPRMKSIAAYLHEMIDQLKVVDLDVRADYDVPGLGFLKGLRQEGYKVQMDHIDRPKRIALQFRCANPDVSQVTTPPGKEADELRLFLQQQQVRFSEYPQRDKDSKVASVIFEGQMQVVINFLFTVDIPSSSIRVVTSNFDALHIKRMQFGYKEVDDAWLDQLGHFILRKNPRLGMLEIGDEHREHIRRQMAEVEAQRRQELAAAEQRLQKEEITESGFFQQLRSALTRPIGGK